MNFTPRPKNATLYASAKTLEKAGCTIHGLGEWDYDHCRLTGVQSPGEDRIKWLTDREVEQMARRVSK